MILSEMMNIAPSNLYKGDTLTVDSSADIEVNENQALVLQPDADGHEVFLEFKRDEVYVVILNDSEFSLVIKTKGRIPYKQHTLAGGEVIKIFALNGYDYVTLNEDVNFEEAVSVPPLGQTEFKIQPAVTNSSMNFGEGTAFNDAGDKCIVGAVGENTNGSWSGSAYIFSWNGTTWVEEQKITPGDGSGGNYFGKRVDMSGDGLRVVISSHGSDQVYVYFFNGTTWTQEQILTSATGLSYGLSINGDGSRIAVGDSSYNSTRGKVSMFDRSGTTWSEGQMLTASDGNTQHYFGESVSLSQDGNTLVIGAYGNADGVAYIFNLSGTWSETQKITGSDIGNGDTFGQHVDIDADGDVIIVGVRFNRAAYIFNLSGTWSQTQKLEPDTFIFDGSFGSDVGINNDGTRVIVGDSGDNVNGDLSGSVYVFDLDGTWSKTHKFDPSDGDEWALFGGSTAISGNGMKIIGGAYWSDSNVGSAYIY